MDMLEHFEDNLNTNISNSVNMANFLKVANTVKKNLNTKYHNGEFVDPAIDAYKDWEWSLSPVWSGSINYKGLNNMALSLSKGSANAHR